MSVSVSISSVKRRSGIVIVRFSDKVEVEYANGTIRAIRQALDRDTDLARRLAVARWHALNSILDSDVTATARSCAIDLGDLTVPVRVT